MKGFWPISALAIALPALSTASDRILIDVGQSVAEDQGGIEEADPQADAEAQYLGLRERMFDAQRQVAQHEKAIRDAQSEAERLNAEALLGTAREDLASARNDFAAAHQQLYSNMPIPPGNGETVAGDPNAISVPGVGRGGFVDPGAGPPVVDSHGGAPRLPSDGAEPVTIPGMRTGPDPGSVDYNRPTATVKPPVRRGGLSGGGSWLNRRPKSPAPSPPRPPERGKTEDGKAAPRRPPQVEIPGQGPARAPSRSAGHSVSFVLDFERFDFSPFRRRKVKTKDKVKRSEAEKLMEKLERAIKFRKYAEALDYADRLIVLAPGDSRVRHMKAMILNRMGRYEDAVSEARNAIRLGVRNAKIYETLAWAQAHLGRFREAAGSASEAIRIDPKAVLAYVIRAYALEKLGEIARARDDLREAAARKPEKYAPMAARAASGLPVFDAEPIDSEPLLEGLPDEPAERSGWGAALVWIGGALLAALSAGGTFLLLRGRV